MYVLDCGTLKIFLSFFRSVCFGDEVRPPTTAVVAILAINKNCIWYRLRYYCQYLSNSLYIDFQIVVRLGKNTCRYFLVTTTFSFDL